MTAPAVLQPARSLVLAPMELRRARYNAGMNRADVRNAINRDESVIARYERGEIDPPASVLAALADLYGVDPGVFFTRA